MTSSLSPSPPPLRHQIVPFIIPKLIFIIPKLFFSWMHHNLAPPNLHPFRTLFPFNKSYNCMPQHTLVQMGHYMTQIGHYFFLQVVTSLSVAIITSYYHHRVQKRSQMCMWIVCYAVWINTSSSINTYGTRSSLKLFKVCFPTITMSSCITRSIMQPEGSHWNIYRTSANKIKFIEMYQYKM